MQETDIGLTSKLAQKTYEIMKIPISVDGVPKTVSLFIG